MHISPIAGPFHSIPFVMMFICYRNTKTPKKHVIWCNWWSGEEIWLWTEALMPRKI